MHARTQLKALKIRKSVINACALGNKLLYLVGVQDTARGVGIRRVSAACRATSRLLVRLFGCVT